MAKIMILASCTQSNDLESHNFQLGRVEELLTMLATRLGAEPGEAGATSTAAAPQHTTPVDEAPRAASADAAALARKRRSKVRLQMNTLNCLRGYSHLTPL